MRTPIILAALCLAACQSTPTPAPVTPATQVVCLPLTTFTPAQEQAAAAALTAITPAQQAALGPIVTDWIAMRDADRACLAK